LLLPVYTPTVTDEENVSEKKVFFSGLSVYLKEFVPWLRRMPQWLERVLDAPAVINALTRLSVSNSPRRLGELTVSMLRGDEGPQVSEFRKLLEWQQTQPRPDVVSIPYTLLISMAGPIKRALGCAVVCTLQGEDLFLESLQEPWRSESLELIRSQVRDVEAFISTSEYYAGFMSGYLRIAREKIHVIPLGANFEGYAREERPADAPFTVGYFARIAPEKGLHNLVEAYRILRKRLDVSHARLEAAGYLLPEHRGYLKRIQRQVREAGLESEFSYRGVLDREQKIRFLQSLDVLSVPSDYPDPKGLFLLEAMACGVSVVQPHHGAFPEIVEKSGGGLLVEPGNPQALAEALASLLRNRELRNQLGCAGYHGVREYFSVQQEAARALEVFAGLKEAARPTSATAGAG
jgi:glycosyltransferase involved in cell wall biosynthesis